MTSGYELIRPLSTGGMGEVYIARRTGTGSFEKRVALKLMLPHLMSAPDQLDRFYREARLAARMHHPNIVEVFDVGELRGRPFIAMQLVEGVTLERLIKEAGRRGLMMPLPVMNAVASSLLEALEYAHTLKDDQGQPLEVIHRDVTPGNVLVSRAGAVLLTDFGIARVGGISHTAPGTVRGKPAYLSPEQILEHAPIDARSDLFSAAVTLYEAATNRHPFRKQTDGATLHAVVSTEPPAPQTLRADLPDSFSTALLTGLSRDPAARFPSAAALRAQLVSGPLATPAEIAAWVKALSPEEEPRVAPPSTLTSVVSTPASSPPRHTVELAPPPQPLPPTARESRSSRRVATALVLVGAALLAVVGWVRSTDAGASETPVAVPAVAAAALAPVVAAPTPAPEAAPPPAVVDAGVAAEARVAQRPKAVPRTQPRLGYLTADARPWADVLIGGAVIDRTPFIRYPLSVGRHVLMFRGPNGESVEKKVVITENGTTNVRVTFEE